MILTLPWPQRILSPNARAHYMAVGKAKKALRAEWAWQAKAQGAGEIAAKSLTVALEFHKPSRRAMDMDNMLASCKAGLDGLAPPSDNKTAQTVYLPKTQRFDANGLGALFAMISRGETPKYEVAPA